MEKAYIVECKHKGQAMLISRIAKTYAKKIVETMNIPYDKLIKVEKDVVFIREECISRRNLEDAIERIERTTKGAIRLTQREHNYN
ncbi:hypothetical protein JXB27_04025 [Candidatus Woesearchaeota archaeon]|nr:hypothetical protein [Candidatus Woesearchaeota archaeon]